MLGGILASVTIALILGLFALKLDANAVLCGVALNLFSTGGTVFVLYSLTGDKGISSSLPSKIIPFIKIPFVENIPWIGKVISGQNLIVWLAAVAVVVIHFILNKATIGRRIRATGENIEAAKAAGIDPIRVKFFTLIVSGVLAGIAGCFLSMGYTSNFTSGIAAGRGYVANAAQVVAGGTAIGAIFASLIFGLTDAMATYLQNIGLPPELIQALPYLVTILGFIWPKFHSHLSNCACLSSLTLSISFFVSSYVSMSLSRNLSMTSRNSRLVIFRSEERRVG